MAHASGNVARKLQLLADALSLEFGRSEVNPQCTAALQRLLPHLEFRSISVKSLAQGGSYVASPIACGTEGPSMLQLHGAISSAAGLAWSSGRRLQASLTDATSAGAAAGLTDVREMTACSPGVTHLLCLPFGSGGTGDMSGNGGSCCSSGCNSGSGSSQMRVGQQQASAAAGSGSGALLLGFSAPPTLDARRLALLAVLAQCLPASMARMSEGALAFASFACGSSPTGGSAAVGSGCCCCCGPSGDWDDIDAFSAEGYASSNAGGRLPLGTGSRAEASQQLLATLLAEPAPADDHFSKDVLRAAAGAGAMAQQPFFLTFLCRRVEQGYCSWAWHSQLQAHTAHCLLVVITMAVLGHLQVSMADMSDDSVQRTSGALVLGAGMVVPAAVLWLTSAKHSAWWERLMGALRLHAIVCSSLVQVTVMRADGTQVAEGHRSQSWLLLWKFAGIESLCITAVCFPMRLRQHLLVQAAALALMAWNMPVLCSQVQSEMEYSACSKRVTVLAVVFGHLLPTIALRNKEQSSRAIFASRLRTAAASSTQASARQVV